MTEQREVKSLMEEYKRYDVGETRYAVIEKKNIGEFMGRCERENWEVKDIRMSDEFVENMNEYFGVRMDMEFIRIGKEHSSDYEKQRTGFFSNQLLQIFYTTNSAYCCFLCVSIVAVIFGVAVAAKVSRATNIEAVTGIVCVYVIFRCVGVATLDVSQQIFFFYCFFKPKLFK
ncbi:Hypothetical predicted protein [Octopus vulgaris]|uniref:Uncharacterized protein n=1 Tax=Octopus vulgaris TaxID=6645 RepID=A0AA36FCB3_OCTVU|nr:Hypothetical predicted protein [Octopus vulgaris]